MSHKDTEPAYDPLTYLERRVYHYVLDFLAEHTYQPSVREIGRKLKIPSTKTVAELLQSLADKGFVERVPGRSRGVKIVGYASMGRVQPVPLYSKVNPVAPYLTGDNRERFIAVDRTFLPSSDVYFLKMTGGALAARNVSDGDWLLVSPTTRAQDGDLVVARVGPHVVARIVTHLGAVISLTTGTTGETEVFLGPSDDFAILGAVVGVWRPFHDAPEHEDD